VLSTYEKGWDVGKMKISKYYDGSTLVTKIQGENNSCIVRVFKDGGTLVTEVTGDEGLAVLYAGSEGLKKYIEEYVQKEKK